MFQIETYTIENCIELYILLLHCIIDSIETLYLNLQLHTFWILVDFHRCVIVLTFRISSCFYQFLPLILWYHSNKVYKVKNKVAKKYSDVMRHMNKFQGQMGGGDVMHEYFILNCIRSILFCCSLPL